MRVEGCTRRNSEKPGASLRMMDKMDTTTTTKSNIDQGSHRKPAAPDATKFTASSRVKTDVKASSS